MLLGAVAFAYISCSGDKQGHGEHASHEAHEHASGSQHTSEAVEPQFQVDDKFQQQLSTAFASYVDLQEALVSSAPKEVQQEASKTSSALASVDLSLLSGAARNDAKTYIASMESSLKEIAASEDIEVQRKSFSALSDNLYKSVKAFGLGGEEAFYTYCPMAFNNEGGHWLSDEEKVSNPYFGDKMLTCGEVKEKLK